MTTKPPAAQRARQPVPQLHRLDVPGRPRGLVLMLHGGQETSRDPVDRRSTSWQRSRWMQRQVARRIHAEGASLWLVRYVSRGWNGGGAVSEPSPVLDARWALEHARGELGPLPVVLLGHSMGARTAVAVAGEPGVVGVVALAPWLPPGEDVAPLSGKRFSAAHGRADDVTSFRATEEFVRRATRVASTAELVDMGPVGHYMLRRTRAWNRFAVTRSLGFLREGGRR